MACTMFLPSAECYDPDEIDRADTAIAMVGG